jgi:hypothetical protein
MHRSILGGRVIPISLLLGVCPFLLHFYPRCHFVQRWSTICFVLLVLLVLLVLGELLIKLNNLPGSLARQPCPAALPGSLARQPCPAAFPAALPGSLSQQP